jgi:hypothetical protein
MVKTLANVDFGRAMKAAEDDDFLDEMTGAKDKPDVDHLSAMATGLGDKYDDFHAYVLAALSDSPLCTIGDGDARMNAGAWDKFAQANGIDGVDRVVGAFAGFFLKAAKAKSKTATGKSSSKDSALPTRDQLAVVN